MLPGTEITFAVDGGQLWLADRGSFYGYRIDSGELEDVRAAISQRVRRMIVHRNKVWIATGDGLYAFDPVDRKVTTNTVKEGLMMPSVTALMADADRIWIGFGGSLQGVGQLGGVGYFELPAHRFVGLMPELPATLVNVKPEPIRRESAFSKEEAPRRYVTGLAKTAVGPLWVATSQRLHRHDPDSNVWEVSITNLSGALSADVVASADYVVVPCYEPSSWSSRETNFGGVFVYDIRKKSYRRLTNIDGLPNNKVHTAVIDGSKVWLGGEGFLAMIDLPSARVEKTCSLSSAYRVRSLTLLGNDLWFTSGPGLYRMSKNAEADSGQQPGEGGGAITDVKTMREVEKQRLEVFRLYNSRDAAEYQQLTARLNAFMRKAARDFPLLEPPVRKGTNQFMELIMNKAGRGYDGFRFRNTLAEPADLGWVFAYEGPTSFFQWQILPIEDTPIAGFTDFFPPKIAYTNAPWSGLKSPFGVRLQFLHDGQLVPGKEYFIWLDYRDEKASRFFINFDLFPGAARNRSRTVLEGAFGLSGPKIPGAY